MNSTAKTRQPIAVTQAKVTRKNGKIEYYFSRPKLKLFDFKGHLWVRRRIKAMKNERTT